MRKFRLSIYLSLVVLITLVWSIIHPSLAYSINQKQPAHIRQVAGDLTRSSTKISLVQSSLLMTPTLLITSTPPITWTPVISLYLPLLRKDVWMPEPTPGPIGTPTPQSTATPIPFVLPALAEPPADMCLDCAGVVDPLGNLLVTDVIDVGQNQLMRQTPGSTRPLTVSANRQISRLATLPATDWNILYQRTFPFGDECTWTNATLQSDRLEIQPTGSIECRLWYSLVYSNVMGYAQVDFGDQGQVHLGLTNPNALEQFCDLQIQQNGNWVISTAPCFRRFPQPKVNLAVSLYNSGSSSVDLFKLEVQATNDSMLGAHLRNVTSLPDGRVIGTNEHNELVGVNRPGTWLENQDHQSNNKLVWAWYNLETGEIRFDPPPPSLQAPDQLQWVEIGVIIVEELLVLGGISYVALTIADEEVYFPLSPIFGQEQGLINSFLPTLDQQLCEPSCAFFATPVIVMQGTRLTAWINSKSWVDLFNSVYPLSLTQSIPGSQTKVPDYWIPATNPMASQILQDIVDDLNNILMYYKFEQFDDAPHSCHKVELAATLIQTGPDAPYAVVGLMHRDVGCNVRFVIFEFPVQMSSGQGQSLMFDEEGNLAFYDLDDVAELAAWAASEDPYEPYPENLGFNIRMGRGAYMWIEIVTSLGLEPILELYY